MHGARAKKKVIICGIKDAAVMAIQYLTDDYEVLCLADNDPQYLGSTRNGFKVISFDEIVEVDFDFIVMASFIGKETKEYLLKVLNISEDKIIDFYHSSEESGQNSFNLMFDARLAILRLCAQEIQRKNIKGAVAELGVFRGDFARHLNSSFPERDLYLFDTFSGFDERDVEIEAQNAFSKAKEEKTNDKFSNTNIDVVLSKMIAPNRCIIKQGYFPETAANVNETFCLVSLDTDLYKPIYEGLCFFYPKIETGGYIFIHDYNADAYKGVREAVRDFEKTMPFKSVPINDFAGSLIITK